MFEPNRSLLNPKFEGYKLDALDQDEIISRFPLQYKLSQTTLSGRTPLSFQEVQSRIRHNHLTIGPGNRAAYVDVDFRVITVTVDEATPIPSFEVVYELPRPIQTSAQDVPQREYPSTAFLTAEVLLVSDGYGSLYAVNLVKSTPNQLLGTFDFLVPDVYESSKRNVPFRLHLAQQTSSDTAILILSSKYYTNETASSISAAEQQPKRANRLSNVKFDIWAVKLTQDTVSQDQILPLDIVWHRRGEDVPQFIMHDASRQAFMLLSSCPYGSIDTAPSSVYEPTSDDMAPILRAGENLNGDSGVVTPLQAPSPPPYSWMQSSDSVTIAFPLPSSTPKSAIRVTFTPRTLTVLVAAETLSPSVVIPKYAAKTLWDGIQPSTSFWTWDKEDNHSFGVLTLHLDKQHEGTRWSQVFAKAGTQPSTSSNSPDDVEVPETLDPSELYNIRESLEKYTAALQSGAKGGIPSLAEGEMDEEIDSEMGKWSFATWVHEDGREPSWSDERGMDAPLSLLSNALTWC